MGKNRKKYILPVLVIAFAVLTVALSFKLRLNQFGSANDLNSTVVQSGEALKPAINGLLLKEREAGMRPLAVMIENHTNSRPQSGLAEADIVYEALAEGGITRFVALYQTSEAKNIGPVRSARDYFATIANEYGALYAHVGGSDEVLTQLKNGMYKNITDLNEYFNASYFQRIKSRPAPHNTYTSTSELRRYLKEKNISETSRWQDWNFTDKDSLVAEKNATQVFIDFSIPSYKVGYIYDTEQKRYKRTLGGATHLDAASKEPLTTKTVVVQFVSVSATPGDAKDRIDVDLIGEGKALVFHDGTVTEARWNKSNSDRTHFSDLNGRAIEFNRGKIWVELVPDDTPNSRVTWKPMNAAY